MAVLDVNQSTYEKEVLQSPLPVFVDVWAPWCGPCRQIAGIVESLSDTFDGKVKFVRVNSDDNPEVAARLGVNGIPALFLVKDGTVAANQVGVSPDSETQLTKMIEENL